MNIVGIDPSLSSTGVATSAGTVRLRSQFTGPARLSELMAAMLRAVHATDLGSGPACPVCNDDCIAAPIYGDHPDLVVIEGYSYGSRNSQAHALGELGGVYRLAMWTQAIPYTEVPPASLKRYATGKGNASKEEVLVAAVRRLGYEGSSNDESDAMWLRVMGLDAYGKPLVVLPVSHRIALAAVTWPSHPALDPDLAAGQRATKTCKRAPAMRGGCAP